LKVLKNKKVNCGGVFHCFTGTVEDAKQIIDLGFKLGIGGVITFKNGKIDKFLNQIDIKNIVLETDSPYLAPTPHRGKRNESSFTDLICKKISEMYKLSYSEVAQITTQNSIEIFKI
jgi:TatD DNase family protein